MPRAPEELGAVVVAHAAHHVFGGVDAVDQGPETEETPGEEELEPDDVEVDEGEEAQLGWCVRPPDGVGLADGAHVVEMQDALHGQQAEEEAHRVADGARALNAGGAVLTLRDVVVERHDGARQVQRGVDGVGHVVAEVVVPRVRRDGDTFALGKLGWVRLLLL